MDTTVATLADDAAEFDAEDSPPDEDDVAGNLPDDGENPVESGASDPEEMVEDEDEVDDQLTMGNSALPPVS